VRSINLRVGGEFLIPRPVVLLWVWDLHNGVSNIIRINIHTCGMRGFELEFCDSSLMSPSLSYGATKSDSFVGYFFTRESTRQQQRLSSLFFPQSVFLLLSKAELVWVTSKGHVTHEEYQCLRRVCYPHVQSSSSGLRISIWSSKYYELKFVYAECVDLNSRVLRALTYESVVFTRSHTISNRTNRVTN